MSGEAAGPALRWSRACITGLVALGLGVVAHASAGGAVPPVAVAALAVALVVGAAAFLGRPATTSRLVALVAAGQALGHLVLTALAGHGSPHAGAGDAPTVSSVTTLGRGPDPGLAPGARTGSPRALVDGSHSPVERADGVATTWAPPHWATHLLDDLSGPHALMAACHLLAAGLLGWWLATGEQALWTLVLLGSREARLAGSRLVTVVAAQALTLRRLFLAWRREAPALLLRERRRHQRDVLDRSSWLLERTREVVPRRGPPPVPAPR